MKKIKGILKRYSLWLSLILVIGIMVAGYFLTNKMRMEIKEIEKEIKDKYSQMKAYETGKEEAPSPELIAKLTREKEYLDRKFNFFMNNFSTTYPVVPEFTLYPSVEYKEFLYFSQDRLYKKAEKRNVLLPGSLGFQTTGLVPPEQIPKLALQFEVVKDLVGLIIDAGVTVVENITPGEPQQVAFYQVLPVKLGIKGTSNEIVRFLKYIENPSSYFLLKNFSVTKEGEGLFRMSAGLNAVIIKKTETKGTEG
ncbi:MAG TPA: Amuc_1100 family pilus-like protein [bacterium]|nr:Amuc_1100 family pilus-like protein [bacterium]HPP29752.1 Amuc_1100 family pilus-like protein [bacterium]